MGSFKVKDDVYWVGARDWNVRWFHGPAYSTHRGSTYNSYLIEDEKNVLVDGVYEPFIDIYLEHISEVIDFKEIDYYVVNHTEPDHSGSFPAVIKKLRDDVTIVCTENGRDSLIEHYGNGYNIKVVDTGDTINIGDKTLAFVSAPMLHWPDSMFTYIPEEKLLLPNDAFGMHLCVSNLFESNNDEAVIFQEAKKYYANILTPFSGLITKKLQQVQEMGIDIEMIAPSHGIIWDEHPEKIINKYAEWAEMKPADKAVIVYETMWDSTEMMARKIADGLIDQGIEVKYFRKSKSDENDMITEVLDAKAIIIGSPTINNVMIPELSPFLEDLEGLRFKNKIGAAFGSKGWAGGAAERIAERMKAARIDLIEDPLVYKYVPDKEQLDEAYQLGKRIAQEIKGDG